MGKKKGKGKGQPQGGTGDQPKPETSGAPEPSTSQEQPKVPETKQQQESKKQQEVASPSTSGPPEAPQGQRKQKQKKKPQEGPLPAETPPESAPQVQQAPQVAPPSASGPVEGAQEQQKGQKKQKQKKKKPQEGSPDVETPPQRVPEPQTAPARPPGLAPAVETFLGSFQQQQAQAGRPPQVPWGPQAQQARGPYPPQQVAPQPQQPYMGPPLQQMQGQYLQQQFPQHMGPPQQPYRGPPQMHQGPPQQFGTQPPGPAWGPQGQQQRGHPASMQFPPGMRPLSPPPFQPMQPQQQQRPPVPQQQRPPVQQQQQRPSVQQQQQRPPVPQQQQRPPVPQQQQRPPVPQQQEQQRPAQQQQQKQQQRRGGGEQKKQPDPRPSTAQAVVPQAKEPSPPLGKGDRIKNLALIKPGTKGKKIQIESNHLALNVGNLRQAVHYDVSIVPDTPKSLLRDVMNVFRQKHYPKRFPAFDGRKNLYSPTRLPLGDSDSKSDVITVEGENRPKEFKVEVKFARMVDLSPLHDLLRTKTSPQDALQCLDIVLRNAPSNTCIIAGRCFFTPPAGQIIDLGDGMEMYYGFYQSAIRGWKPLLNVDVAHKAFPKSTAVLDLICDLGSDYRYTMSRNDLDKPLTGFLFSNLEKFLKTLKVKYEITGQSSSKRIYRVNGLGEPASKAKFKLEDGRETTVEKYFQEFKRIRLRYPNLPTLWVGARDRQSKILLPLEFCTVVEGQAINRKMNENQTSAMIKKSATSTEIRKKKIMDTLNKARFNDDPCIREFGFSVNNAFEKLEARVLTPPSLLYAQETIVTPQKGVWRNDRGRFLQGATINKWTIASVTRQPARAEQLAEMVFKMAGASGINMQQKASAPFVHISGRQPLQDITNYFKTKQDFDLIFVVVPNSGPQYSYVKQAAEINVGCLTQCIKERTLMKLNPQTVGNILLKVNSKMNGTNHAFSPRSRPMILLKPCMIMGADVTHPSPDSKDIPSVAAVTASHDPKAFQYNICWRLQPPRMEIIEDLYNITIEQLYFFYKKTGCKPERIVFFRDGVSEGQFREVQSAEIRAIQAACKKVQADGYEPSITFLVVQKRHHTRLFPTNPRDSEDKNMNVPAGTCVDTHITNPTMQDFYLVSHASIQGVAKPTKYCTLWDDNDMSNDDIEELTYHLCHMFTRCNRSVSYPAPTYYAHLAAARAKVYIENDKLNMDRLKEHQDKLQIKECISKGKPMFFV